MPEVESYTKLQCELASRGLTYCPITESEYYEVVYSGLGFDGAISVALDVHCGCDFDESCLVYLNNLIKKAETNAT